MAHVLIGFAEALPAPEVVFSLSAAGHRVSAFARRADLPLARLPLESLTVLPDPAVGTAAAIAAIRDLAANGTFDAVLPLDDDGLWLVNAALPHADIPPVAGATGAQAALALDKIQQVKAARAAGLQVPETCVIRQPSDLDPDRLPHLPAIAKPAMAVTVAATATGKRLTKGDATYLLTRADVDTLRATLGDDMQPLLVQPLIPGTGEGVFGLATEAGVIAWSGHRRLRMMNPHGSGSSACTALAPTPDLRDYISAFVATAGWRGPFMMEFLRDTEGTPWFMELNGRMWGSLALARRQGLEYPAWSVATTLDPDTEIVPPAAQTGPPLVLRHLGRDLLHLLFVLRGPKSAFHRPGWPRFLTSLRGVLAPTTRSNLYNHDPAHRGYVWRDTLWTVRKVLRR